MPSPKKILPTVLFLPLWLFIILFKFGGGLSYTLLPTLGEKILPIWLVGILIGASALLQLIADIPAGIILDRFGYVRMIRIGTLLFALGGVALLFGLTVWSFCALLLSCSFGWLFFLVQAYAPTSCEKLLKNISAAASVFRLCSNRSAWFSA